MRMFDIDNSVVINLHISDFEAAKRLIEQGKVRNGWGEREDLEDCLDKDGDLCVDESMFFDIKIILQI